MAAVLGATCSATTVVTVPQATQSVRPADNASYAASVGAVGATTTMLAASTQPPTQTPLPPPLRLAALLSSLPPLLQLKTAPTQSQKQTSST